MFKSFKMSDNFCTHQICVLKITIATLNKSLCTVLVTLRVHLTVGNESIHPSIRCPRCSNTDRLNFQEINYDSPRGGVSVITEKGDITVSYLLVQRARDSDSGKYTCNPSNANPKTVTVHVLNGK